VKKRYNDSYQNSAVAILLLERPRESGFSKSVPHAFSKGVSSKCDIVTGLDINGSTCFTRKG